MVPTRRSRSRPTFERLQFENQVIGVLKVSGKNCVRWSELEVKDERHGREFRNNVRKHADRMLVVSTMLLSKRVQTYLNSSVIWVEKGTGAER